MKWYKVTGYQVEATKNGKYIRNSVTKVIKNQYVTKTGYIQVLAKTDGGVRKVLYVHRLIAVTFVDGKTRKRPHVNHKNLIKSDNHYKNLEWCNRSENMRHAVRNGVKIGNTVTNRSGKNNPMYGKDHTGENNGNAKLTWKIVKLIRKLYATGKYTQTRLAKLFKVHKNVICDVVNFNTWLRR
jgi:hypothetical protein